MNRNPEHSVPKDAKCVFNGVLFEVWQWQQKMYDGNTQTFEMLKRPDTAVVIAITPDKKFIVLEEEQPGKGKFFSLPGGRFDEAESDGLLAAKRELLEETGYASENWDLYFVQQPASKIDWLIYFYIAKESVKIAPPRLDGGEKIKPDLLDFQEFMKFMLDPKFTEVALRIKALEAAADLSKLAEMKKKFGV